MRDYIYRNFLNVKYDFYNFRKVSKNEKSHNYEIIEFKKLFKIVIYCIILFSRLF